MKTTNVTEKAFAGNPHARLDEGEVASAMPRRGSLHYNMKTRMVAFVAAAVVVARLFAVTSVVYDASDPKTSYADGAVSVSYDGDGAITSITADTDAAGAVSFSGDAMTLSSSEADISVAPAGSLSISNALNATGMSSESPATVTLGTTTAGEKDFTLTSKVINSEQLVAPGMTLASITNITCRFNKDASAGGSGFPVAGVKAYHFKFSDPKIATFQFQKRMNSSVLRAVCVQLTQKDDGVYAKNVGYGHINPTNDGVDIWEGDIDITVTHDYWMDASADSPYYVGCFVTNMTLQCETAAGGYFKFSSDGALVNTFLKIGDGTSTVYAELLTKEVFPTSGKIEVGTNSCLYLKKGGSNVTGLDRYTPTVVRKGGIIATKASSLFAADYSSITLDGGTLWVDPGLAVTYDGSFYVKNVLFRDGALLRGTVVRVRSANVTWTVEGLSPSRCENIIDVWNAVAEGSANYKTSTFTMDVADITGGVAADFVCAGTIRPTTTSAAGYTKARVAKTGAGTVSIEAHYMMTNTPTRIEAGTFLVNGDYLDTTDACPFVLAGGTFAVAVGSTNTCGTLVVESTSTISVADGASLSFAASGGESWDGELTLRCNLEACSIRFGTGSDGLTRGQCKKISLLDGRHVRLDENGYLVGVGSRPGFVIIFQ